MFGRKLPSTLSTARRCGARVSLSAGSAVWPTIAVSSGSSGSTSSSPADEPSCQVTRASASSRARVSGEKICSSVRG